ncbi:hypothetical protein Scep_029509 [Stephania cephalantha]|uniref:Uncharacterized protein n=1 Tax=Stephania cephalantha TaxID=152367 RepID=A0AAP0HCA0_9MAGN
MHHLYLHSRRHPFLPRAFATCQAILSTFHYLSWVEPWDLMVDLKCHLQMLCVQSFQITLTSYVLPRLLAQS